MGCNVFSVCFGVEIFSLAGLEVPASTFFPKVVFLSEDGGFVGTAVNARAACTDASPRSFRFAVGDVGALLAVAAEALDFAAAFALSVDLDPFTTDGRDREASGFRLAVERVLAVNFDDVDLDCVLLDLDFETLGFANFFVDFLRTVIELSGARATDTALACVRCDLLRRSKKTCRELVEDFNQMFITKAPKNQSQNRLGDVMGFVSSRKRQAVDHAFCAAGQ